MTVTASAFFTVSFRGDAPPSACFGCSGTVDDSDLREKMVVVDPACGDLQKRTWYIVLSTYETNSLAIRAVMGGSYEPTTRAH
jgi:hypothetical protein